MKPLKEQAYFIRLTFLMERERLIFLNEKQKNILAFDNTFSFYPFI